MKRFTAIILALLLVVSSAAVSASADTTEKVFVSIADENGSLVLARKEVTASDIDADGAITINDVLYAAHETFFEGGAEAGYASYTGDYGLSLSKLWGVENGGSYGYYVNNASAWSLADPVAEGAHVYAFIYTDTTAWSDTYSWFEKDTVDAKAGESITLTLKSLGYDADWNPVAAAEAGAVIYVNGTATDAVTDENGQATITLSDEGSMLISAKSDSKTLVPPVCIANVKAAAAAEDTTEAPELPKTGTAPVIAYVFAGMAMILAGITVIGADRKKENEI